MREIPIPSLAELAAVRQQIELDQEPEGEYQLDETSELTILRGQAPVTQLNAELNHIFRPRGPDFFLHPGRVSIISSPASNYEHIFSTPGLSRRAQRVRLLDSSDGSPGFDWDSMDIVREWYDQCVLYPTPDHDDLMPKALAHKHDAPLLDFLPERLRWNSEIGRHLRHKVRAMLRLTPNRSGELMEYEARLGDGRRERRIHQGMMVEMLPFLGDAAPGNVIECRTPLGYHLRDDDLKSFERYEEMRHQLFEADRALSTLARRVAGWVAQKIVYEFVVPETYRQEGRNVLDREQINRAVSEVLGEEWFAMPCDRTGKLRNWTVDDAFEPGVEIEVDGDGEVTHYVRTEEL